MRRIRHLGILLALCFGTGAQAQNWQHVGPLSNTTAGNLFNAGRSDCIVTDFGFNGTTNQVMYTGSTAAGLWKTTDMGANWNPVAIPDYVTYHGISALEVISSSYMLAATYNVGLMAGIEGNIYQYYPGTNTWTASNFSTVSSSAHVNHITVCPASALIVFAAARNGLYKSTDGGMTWTLAAAGNFENVDFVPATWATNGYEVYATGQNTVIFSSNMGASFATKTTVTTVLGATFYGDMSVTYDVANPNNRYIYFAALVGTNHHIVRLVIDQNVQANQSVNNYGQISEPAPAEDRMCVAAYDQVVYFGHGGLGKYNATTGFFYQVSGASDAVGGIPYGSPGHPDNHDMLILPSLNKMFLVNDGGVFVNNYTPAANGVYANSWAWSNNGLHISQIWGLSVADDDPNFYITGEQDSYNGGFVSDAASGITVYGGGTEPSHVIMDKFNHDNYMHAVHSSSHELYIRYNSAGSPVHTPNLYVPTSSTDLCSAPAADLCPFPCHPGAEFSNNTLFQDPNRPDKIYFGTKNTGLFEFCPTNKVFVLKKGFLPSSTSWQQFVNGMAFSRADKNKVHVLISNRNIPSLDERQPEVYKFTGPDFDDSWNGHNDANWTAITPNYAAAPFTTPVTWPATAQIQMMGIAASDWNPDRIWVAIRYVPGNPNLKVITYDGSSWTDYSSGIPSSEIPVSLVYEQGTNDQMYLGTNVNVYYRDANMSSWQLYSGTLPNLAMNQLRINYGDNTVRAGTYGHGMWSSDLRCPASGPIGISAIYYSDAFVEAQHINVIYSGVQGADVKMRATEYIDLWHDSHWEASGTNQRFFAFIHDCDNPGNSFRKAGESEELNYWEEAQEAVKPERVEELLSVYPNPSEGIFNLRKESEDAASIEVLDLMGKSVLTLSNQTGKNCVIDLSEQADGIYFVKVTIKGKPEVLRIIKQ